MSPESQPQPYEDTLQEVLREYNLKPKKWKVSMGRSRDCRYFDLIISQGSRIWQIKLDSLYKPAPIGIGASIEDDEREEKNEVPFYGFRSISNQQLSEIQSGEDLTRVLEEIMRAEPVPASRIEHEPGFLQGPVAIKGNPLSLQPLSFISEKQKTLDRMLTQELSSLVFKRYSGMDYL